MTVFGLTGPSGAGKAVVGCAFDARGIPVLDTDALYHSLIAGPSPCTSELCVAFGDVILSDVGGIDRKKLAAVVFCGGDLEKERLSVLNRITHRYVLAGCRSWLEKKKSEGMRAAVIDAPLLIEADFHTACDYVIAVLAPRELRLSRIMARDGIGQAAAEARISAQKSDDFYRGYADFVFINDGEITAAEDFADRVIRAVFTP